MKKWIHYLVLATVVLSSQILNPSSVYAELAPYPTCNVTVPTNYLDTINDQIVALNLANPFTSTGTKKVMLYGVGTDYYFMIQNNYVMGYYEGQTGQSDPYYSGKTAIRLLGSGYADQQAVIFKVDSTFTLTDANNPITYYDNGFKYLNDYQGVDCISFLSGGSLKSPYLPEYDNRENIPESTKNAYTNPIATAPYSDSELASTLASSGITFADPPPPPPETETPVTMERLRALVVDYMDEPQLEPETPITKTELETLMLKYLAFTLALYVGIKFARLFAYRDRA